jgi:CRAL/TRIO domain
VSNYLQLKIDSRARFSFYSVFVPIPTPYGKDSPIIYLTRCGTFEVDDYSFPDVLAVAYINIDILLSTCDNHAIGGQITIVDLKLVDMHVMSQMTPTELHRAIHFNKNVIPIRTKAFHFINVPSFFLKIFNGIKGTLPQKFRDRMMVHATIEDLQKYIPKKALPSDYGGDLPSINQLTSDWEAVVMAHRDRLLAQKKYGVDESKRQSKSKQDNLMSGSFRKLEVD